jgi:hypothetical protein
MPISLRLKIFRQIAWGVFKFLLSCTLWVAVTGVAAFLWSRLLSFVWDAIFGDSRFAIEAVIGFIIAWILIGISAVALMAFWRNCLEPYICDFWIDQTVRAQLTKEAEECEAVRARLEKENEPIRVFKHLFGTTTLWTRNGRIDLSKLNRDRSTASDRAAACAAQANSIIGIHQEKQPDHS